ncbi:glycosyl hydrolase [Nocardioides sp. WG-D5]
MARPVKLRPLLVATSLSLAAFATILVPLGAPAAAQPERPGSAFTQQFAAGDARHGAMFRWWWTSAVDADVAAEQLREVAGAGYKGVEIAFVMDGLDYVVDTDHHEYGDDGWRAAVRVVLAEANRLGLQVDLTLGGRWPAAVPGLDVSSDAASQELTTGTAVVEAGVRFNQALPQPVPLTYEDRTMEDGEVVTTTRTSPASYVAATATRCMTECGDETPVLDLETVVDLRADVSDGRLDWTAPTEGTWVVTSYWRRGTAQRNDAPFGSSVSPWSEPESRVVDHFGEAGTRAILAFYGEMLDGPTRRLLRQNGGSLFEDSLELKHAQAWTPGFLDSFEESQGYRLEPYLPVLAKLDASGPFAEPAARYDWVSGQDDIATRVTHDVEDTLDDLYITEHVRPIRAWANRLGLDFRAQPYGEAIDLGGAAQELDVSECESLGCSEEQFRALAGGVTAARKTLLSSEMLPGGFGNLYGLTPAEIAALANKEYSFGANQMVFHGLPYRELPPAADGSDVDTSAAWPGFHAFSARIGEAFGPRQPAWTMEPAMGDYYARIQQVLQAGTARFDVAVLDGDGAFLGDTDLTYSYLTADSLAGLPVGRGRLAPDGASYGALVVGDEPIDLTSARDIERMAAAGLPVVLMAGGPQRAAGYAASAEDAAADDAEVVAVFDRIAALPSGLEAADKRAAVALLEQHVAPSADGLAAGVEAVRRESGATTFTALFNRGTSDVSTKASLRAPRAAVPYLLDPWSGEITAIGDYTRVGGRIEIDVDLAAGDSALVALAGPSFAGGAQPVAGPATPIAGEIALPEWSLSLDEYLPGGATDPAHVTRHVTRTIDGVELAPWSEIEGIEDAVGVVTYRTTVTVSRKVAAVKTLLDLGEVAGAYRVRLNGTLLPTPDQLDHEVDLEGGLVPGVNTIEIEVASPLLNRLRITRPAEFGSRTPTVNGLLGPVVLKPYVERDR